MAEPTAISVDEVARKQFNTAFRGFDQYEVRAYLATLSNEIAQLVEHQRALQAELDAARAPGAAAPAAPLPSDDLDAALGAETARVLHAARVAAQEIRTGAEEHVARLVRESSEEVGRLRAEAESVLSQRTQEADEAVAALLADAREQGKAMLAEAQAVRERVLKDLARRRRLAVAQLELLEQGRSRLADAFEQVRVTVDEATAAVDLAAEEAGDARRLAAEQAPAPAERDEPDRPVAPDSATAATADAPPEAEAEPRAEETATAMAGSEGPAARAPEARPPATVPLDDRRSSSLRLLRRRPGDGVVDDLGDDLEGVRIIRPERPGDAAAAGPDADADVQAEVGVDAAAPAGVEVEHEADAVRPSPEPVPADEEGAPPAGEQVPVEEQVPVDDLFARLRADRAAAVAEAEVVLARDEPEAAPAEAAAADGDTADGDTVDGDAADGDAVTAGDDEPPVADDTPFERRDGLLEEGERALTRALKRALTDEQNEVLDALRRRKGPARLEVLLPTPEAQRARYAAAGSATLQAAAAAGAESVAGATTGDLPDVAPDLGGELADDVRVRLGRAVESTGSDDEALVEAISGTYREWKTARVEPLARHYTAAAFAAGAYAVAPEGPLRWTVDPAEGGCPDCDDNALAGPTQRGDAFPTGQLHPPAHAGCRCLALPAH